MQSFFKILSWLMVLLFAWAAYVQINDPDSFMWILIYGIAALGSLLFALGKLPYWVSLLLGIAFLVGAFMFWPETYEGVGVGDMEMKTTNVERGRESLGLGIAALVFLIFSWRIRVTTK
ncbi:Transmembrane family 220, helix [Robiginitalea myxolifaciens]|uniref:Transmembrane family 220, helix n=1 Tax=Robiginitalea myxolifaciens TaxID=400055 RepID=A0A1I6H3M3_9FLAO|nr:transmembrane 220 family protein [Robiginitalea myxolifaciens]SFR49066.1 Transmembrane family 220, helix [Robiginitalea myxolifaciens]